MAGETESPKPKRTRKFTIARRITVLIPVALLVVGLAFNTGTGTLSSFGWRDIAAICPLGVLETMIATATAIPRWIIVLALFVIFVLLFGRAFCAWLCPVPPISSLGKGLDKKRTPDEVANPPRRRKVDSRHAVLLGALLSTGIFGYPVFCLVCPVGLTFATIICLWRAFQFAEPTWGLLVFPLIIVVEVVVFRKWCHTLCPLSALMSLIGQGNRTFKPSVDREKCIHAKGGSCLACNAACPENLSLHRKDERGSDFAECTRCGECAEACPVQAIAFRLKSFGKESETR